MFLVYLIWGLCLAKQLELVIGGHLVIGSGDYTKLLIFGAEHWWVHVFWRVVKSKSKKTKSKKDAKEGIDVEITKDDETLTGQIKPYREMILDGDTITLMGTASVKLYKTDLMIFQKGKNVLIFNKKPKIVDGNFVFPIDSLVYNIQ